MIFESINYSFALQDFIFSTAAGFAVGFINQVLSAFLGRGKTAVFFKDIIVSFIFAVTVFSYVISFTNYPIIRIYHILGGLLGFWCFSYRFSIFLQKSFEKILKYLKNKMLCYGKKLSTIICVFAENKVKKRDKSQKITEETHLQIEEVMVYNL